MIAGLEILNLHAQGGMAEVYRARGKGADGTEYLYAVKRILPEYTRDPEIKKMFIEESRVAACLVHPSVVRVYDLATAENEELYIVMEFLEGKDLSEAIEEAERAKKPLPIWFAIQVARDVLRALHYVTNEATDKNGHTLGLIHRDISPHNIFVCFDGQVKLTDFGVAKVQESNVKTQVGITKGKLGYMSPEQLMGGQLDFRSDLYNVGILLFESITGRQLFQGATTAEFLQSMVRGIVPPIPPSAQVPPELEALIRRTLDRDRTKRPETALSFERELAEIAQRYNLVAQPAHVAHQMRELYGRVEAPQLVKPATAPQKLRSMMLEALDPAQMTPLPVQQAPQTPVAQAPVHRQPPVQQPPVQQPPVQRPPVQQPQAQQPQVQQPQAQQQPVQQVQQRAPVQQPRAPVPQAPLPQAPLPQPPIPQPAAQPFQPQAYKSPYAQPQAVSPAASAPLAIDVEDDFATVVRPPDPDSMWAPPSGNARAAAAVDARQSPVRPPSRPNQPLPPVAPSQPRVQVAVSARMRTLPTDDQTAATPNPGAHLDQLGTGDDDGMTATVEVSPQMLEAALKASSRRPSTMARGNARPLESLPAVPPRQPSSPKASNWAESTGNEEVGDSTRIEANPPTKPPAPSSPPASPSSSVPRPRPESSNPVPRAPGGASGAAPGPPSTGPNRPATTVQVGGSGVGARSKKVVPLDDIKR